MGETELPLMTIGEISHKVTKGTTPTTLGGRFSDSGINFIKVESIAEGGRINHDKLAYIDNETHNLLSRSKLQQDDLLFTIAGTIGRVAHVTESILPANTNQAIAIIRPKKEIIDPQYLYYVLNDVTYLREANAGVVQSVQANFSLGLLANIRVPVPKIEVQRRIAHILGTLDNKIELNRRMNATLEAIARALFKSWFVDFDPVRAKAAGRPSGLPPALDALFPSRFVDSELGEIPEGWVAKKMRDVVTPLLGGTPSRNVSNYWEDGTIPWINSGEVNNFRIITPTEKITQEGLENSSTKLIPPRTVVIAITGATLGQVSLVEIETTFNQSIVAIPGTESVPSEYLYLWIKSKIDTITSSQTGGAQQHINKGNVSDSILLVPIPEVIGAFYRKSSQWFDLITTNEFEISQLASLRNTLLPKLIRETK